MLKAFLAVLAIVALVPLAVPSRAAPMAPVACDGLQAYAVLRGTGGLAVRAGPGTQFAPVARLRGERDGSDSFGPEVTIVGSVPGWLRISDARLAGYVGEERPIWHGDGWIGASLVRVSDALGEGVGLRRAPDGDAPVFATLRSDDDEVPVLGCSGPFLQVKTKQHGVVWIDRWCTNQATTCS